MRYHQVSICIVLLACAAGGCTRMLAERLVDAPNRDWPASAKGDTPPEELARLYVDREIRIPVGPPDATLSVWVIDPYRGHETFGFVTDHGRIRAVLHRPTTTTTTLPSASEPPKATVFLLHGVEDEKSLGPYVLYR